MAKVGRVSWLRIDDGFIEHGRIEGLSDRAFRLHVAGLCHCAKNLTDGLVTEPSLRSLCGRLRASRKHVSELVDAGLWLEHEARSAHIIRDYLDYNPTRTNVKEKQAGARERMQRVRANKQRTNGDRSREVRGPHPLPLPNP